MRAPKNKLREKAARKARASAPSSNDTSRTVRVFKWVFLGLMCSGVWTLFMSIGQRGGRMNKAAVGVRLPVNNPDVIAKGATDSMTLRATEVFTNWTFHDVMNSFRGNALSAYAAGDEAKLPWCADSLNTKPYTDEDELPVAYDFREQYPDCLVPQYELANNNCSTAWAAAATGTFAAQLCMSTVDARRSGSAASRTGEPLVLLSAQDLMSCHPKYLRGCEGSFLDAAAIALGQEGVVTHACLEWNGGLTRDGQCERCATEQPVRSGAPCRLRIKDLRRHVFDHGPTLVLVLVTDQLLLYGSGVYSPTKEAKLLINPASPVKDKQPLLAPFAIMGWSREGFKAMSPFGPSWGTDGEGELYIETDVQEDAMKRIVYMDLALHIPAAGKGRWASQSDFDEIPLEAADEEAANDDSYAL